MSNNSKDKKSCKKNMSGPLLEEFMNEHRIRKGDPFTHTSKEAKYKDENGNIVTIWTAGAYYIGEDDLEKFFLLYSNTIAERKVSPTITERPTPIGKPIGPLRVDFDLKSYTSKGLERRYTPFIINRIVKMYQEEIRKIVDRDSFDNKLLYCLVLEKEKPRKEKDKTHGTIVKDGFHLHFPHFICTAWTSDNYLRDRISSRMQSEKIWAGIDLIEGVENIIDRQMACKTWLMYGSTNYKSKNSKPYLCTKAYDHNGVSTTLENIFEEEMIGRSSRVKYYLPQFLSIKGWDEPTELSSSFSVRMPKPRKIIVARTRSDEEVMSDIKRIEEGELIDLLSIERITERNSWMDLGWTLFNIGQGCDEALQLWIDASMRSPKFLEGECETEWEKMEMRGRTMSSLIKMVQEDNPEEFRLWQTTQIDFMIEESLREVKPTECDLANVVYSMYEGRFICARAKTDRWYEFKNHRWMEIDDAHSIKLLLTTEVRDQYNRFSEKLMNLRRGLTDDGEIKKIEDKIKRCFNICHELKMTRFHDRIIKACKLKMFDSTFGDKLDLDPLLIGCENGVLDLKIHKFRPGRPDDYISMNTKIHFREYTDDDYQVIKLHEFFNKIFPDTELREYFWTFFSSCLQSGNVNKTFLLCTGLGNNGKSKTFKLAEFALGDYCMKLSPETLVAGRGSAGGARSDLVRVAKAKIVQCDEIAEHEKANIGALKQLTGGDSVPARDLFERGRDQKDIQANFSLMIQCNVLFKIPGQDEATWARVRVLDFESEFVKPKELDVNPVADDLETQMKERKFVADITINDTWLVEMAPVFLWLLWSRFPEYMKNGIKEPEKVRASTDVYRGQNDIYRQFISDHLVKCKGEEESMVSVSEAAKLFKGWYKENYPSYARDKESQVDMYTFKRQMIKRLGKTKGMNKKESWLGWKLIEEENEDPTDFK